MENGTSKISCCDSLHSSKKITKSSPIELRQLLKEFTDAAHNDPRIEERRSIFERTFDFLARCFPEGLTGKSGQTPVNLFEGVSVGCALALEQNPQLHPAVDPPWIKSDDLRKFITAATNSF